MRPCKGRTATGILCAKHARSRKICRLQWRSGVSLGLLLILPTHPKGELLLGLADGYGRLGNEEKALVFYQQVLKELPGTAYAKKANNWMETKASQTACLGCHTGK